MRETKDTLCSCFGKLNVVNISFLNKYISRFNDIPTNMSAHLLDIDNRVLKFILESHMPQETKNNFKTEE